MEDENYRAQGLAEIFFTSLKEQCTEKSWNASGHTARSWMQVAMSVPALLGLDEAAPRLLSQRGEKLE